jgi:hypothetical protein
MTNTGTWVCRHARIARSFDDGGDAKVDIGKNGGGPTGRVIGSAPALALAPGNNCCGSGILWAGGGGGGRVVGGGGGGGGRTEPGRFPAVVVDAIPATVPIGGGGRGEAATLDAAGRVTRGGGGRSKREEDEIAFVGVVVLISVAVFIGVVVCCIVELL